MPYTCVRDQVQGQGQTLIYEYRFGLASFFVTDGTPSHTCRSSSILFPISEMSRIILVKYVYQLKYFELETWIDHTN